MALKLVDIASNAGADCVKFQTFKADKLVTQTAPKADYQTQATDSGESQYEMLKQLELTVEMHKLIMEHCRKQNILFLSSPFDEDSSDLLEDLGVAAFKIPSGEITNLAFLEHVARKGMPMLVSTGMANMGEVAAAVNVIERYGRGNLALLQCVSNYPADPADANLRAMHTMATAFDLPVGYSDHTSGTEVAVASVALGACVVEKHFTLDSNLPGPDHLASLEPEELLKMVRGIRTVESALGHGRKEPATSEANTTEVARKSLVAARDIEAGATLTEELVAVKRPGNGLPPAMRSNLIGRTVRTSVPAGALFDLDMLA
jgi:N-acetylneuraminate synthase